MPLATPTNTHSIDTTSTGERFFTIHGTGLIQINHWNPDAFWSVEHYSRPNEEFEQWLDSIPDGDEDFADWEEPYGVCDSPQQFLAKDLAFLKDLDFNYCVFFVHIQKHPGEKYGWRWHKWGSYIGEGTPQCEYLDDEPGFDDGVYTYSVYKVFESVGIEEIET